MSGDCLLRAREQITPGKSFQKAGEIFDGGFGRREAEHLFEIVTFRGRFSGTGLKTLFVDAAIQIIRRGCIKLPEHFRFPGSKRFGIDGFDVGVSEKAE